jgi:hypothetical protein
MKKAVLALFVLAGSALAAPRIHGRYWIGCSGSRRGEAGEPSPRIRLGGRILCSQRYLDGRFLESARYRRRCRTASHGTALFRLRSWPGVPP